VKSLEYMLIEVETEMYSQGGKWGE